MDFVELFGESVKAGDEFQGLVDVFMKDFDDDLDGKKRRRASVGLGQSGKGLQSGTEYVQNLVKQLINGRKQIDASGETSEAVDNTQTLASMRVLTQMLDLNVDDDDDDDEAQKETEAKLLHRQSKLCKMGVGTVVLDDGGVRGGRALRRRRQARRRAPQPRQQGGAGRDVLTALRSDERDEDRAVRRHHRVRLPRHDEAAAPPGGEGDPRAEALPDDAGDGLPLQLHHHFHLTTSSACRRSGAPTSTR